jgi:hypothetical protein
MRLLPTVLLGTALIATTAMAQSGGGDGRSILRASLGVGGGSLGLNCSDCSNDRTNGLAFIFRVGAAIAPDMVVGAEFTRWSEQVDAGTSTASWAMAVIQVYPRPRRGFFVKGGLGVAALDVFGVIQSTGIPFGLRTTNLGLEVGVGDDVRVSRRVSLTPYADFLYAVPANPVLSLNQSTTGSNLGGNLVHVGLAVSWR